MLTRRTHAYTHTHTYRHTRIHTHAYPHTFIHSFILTHRPELRETSALVYAVRLARPACVAALLEASLAPLNLPDGWGVTATAYAAYMVARDKHNTTLQHVYDMLLAKLPQVCACVCVCVFVCVRVRVCV